MPSWWRGRLKSKSKSKSKSTPALESRPRKNPEWEDDEGDSSLTPKHWLKASKEKASSFDGVLVATKANQQSAGGAAATSSSGADGESRSFFAFGHPLPSPRQFVSSPLPSPPPLDLGTAAASGSASASSVSSSGSSDDALGLYSRGKLGFRVSAYAVFGAESSVWLYDLPVEVCRVRFWLVLSVVEPCQQGNMSRSSSVGLKFSILIIFCGISRFSDQVDVLRGRHVFSDPRRHQHVAEDRHMFSCSPVLEHPNSSEITISLRKETNLHGLNTSSTYPETIFNTKTVSCSPSSLASPFSTSPMYPRALHTHPGAPSGRQDGLRSPPQPLPLPPVSPSSPSSSSHYSQSQWKKGKLLGRGTFGHVYLGFNGESGQMCAIKEVSIISDDSNSKESLKQLNQVNDTLSVFLEYVSGGSIHKLLQEYGPFGEPVIRSYSAQLLSGLAYLHGRNTVHRDIKGANVLVDPNGEVKLADFGMAKHMSSYTSIRSFKGSPYWMAPEVIMNGNGYNLSVDIWSLGCTILEMATSKPPWSQFEGVAAIFKIGNSKDIPDIPDSLSSEAKCFVKSCLQRDPLSRPTAAQLMNHPFVRDQAAIKAAKSSLMRDVVPPFSNRSHSKFMKDAHRNRSVSPLRDETFRLTSRVAISAEHKSPSDLMGARMNMSLPVSPCSSPRRREHNQCYRSCLPSPTHPAYSAGALIYGPSNHALYHMRPSQNFPGPFLDISELRIQTPHGSPRR
ncbi:Mitogen-activated protein kinase kinase kinase YODA [Apostasia shenzhenica]|uniref:mitogen-activated protein kinase kinase kinase n=1 Tax=Apostasia shenzhenica TaxID=1088818 RepID=A0A2I0ANI3_9ASPA|nr:Mitogen-activated protein kinase kinase kinase YODA [Apostasia shenzhenica]